MAPPSRSDPAGPHAAIKRELLVRLLDGWLPAALHSTGRATYLDAYPTSASVAAALRVTAEFPDLLTRKRLDVVLIDGGPGPDLTVEVAAIRRQITPPAGVTVQIVPGAGGGRLPPPRLLAAGPLLGFLDAAGLPAPDPAELAYLVTGARAQALLALDASAAALDCPAGQPGTAPAGAAAGGRSLPDYRRAMAGSGAVTCVETVARDGRAELLFFRTPAARGLETFKDALWAVDEYAGVRYRDPRDPDRALLDISLNPHPGPLRRALLAHLADTGPKTLAELRGYALAETVYRPGAVAPVLTAMVAAGLVGREPAKGRLTADSLISLR